MTSAEVSDKSGTYVSGFAPVIETRSRKSIALVGVDVKLDSIGSKMTLVRVAALAGGAMLLVLVTAMFVAFFISLRALAIVKMLEAEIQKQNSEVRGKNIYLG